MFAEGEHHAALVLVGQDLKRFVDLFEVRFRVGIVGVSIGVMLQRLALVGLAHLVGRRSALDTEHLVITTLVAHELGHPIEARASKGPTRPAEGKSARGRVNARLLRNRAARR